jgi:dipeptidyl aminopeptidase/acylaminoacyl peptidase
MPFSSSWGTGQWSPDGRLIAGVHSTNNGYSLQIVNVADGAVHAVGTGYVYEPVVWAPRGRQLAYVTGDAPGHAIYVVRSDASDQRFLVAGEEPAWSPDSNEVAFSRGLRYCGGTVGIVPADGGAARVLATGAEAPSQPVWSPDGQRLAYSTLCPPRAYVINRDGSGRRLLAEFEPEQYAAPPALAWSSDGQWLSAEYRHAITLLEVDGSRRITFPVGGEWYQQTMTLWSPVSDELLFTRHDPAGDVVAVGSVDGSQRVIAHASYADWSPDGTSFAVLQELYRDPLAYASCADQLRILDLSGKVLAGLTPCRFEGTRGANTIVGTVGADVIVAGNGADRVSGGLGADRIFGGAGRDRIVGGPGRDTVYAGSGADRVFVRDGQPDQVYCAAGTDTVTADVVDVVSRDCERVQRR